MDLLNTYTYIFAAQDINSWTFLSAVWTDGTHSLPRIHWLTWCNAKSLQICSDKETNSSTSWMPQSTFSANFHFWGDYSFKNSNYHSYALDISNISGYGNRIHRIRKSPCCDPEYCNLDLCENMTTESPVRKLILRGVSLDHWRNQIRLCWRLDTESTDTHPNGSSE